MKVLAINGSARKDGNTAAMIKTVFAELEKEGIETELIQLAGRALRGCTACGKCWETKNNKCILEDGLNDYYSKMLEADAIILGSPTYFADVSAEMKALIDRAGFLALANDGALTRKVGAAVVAVRRAGAVHVFDSINHFFFINQMIVPGSSYWNMSLAMNPGDYNNDAEGIRTMENLGKNMAWLLKKINA